jgi:hypothetical protein
MRGAIRRGLAELGANQLRDLRFYPLLNHPAKRLPTKSACSRSSLISLATTSSAVILCLWAIVLTLVQPSASPTIMSAGRTTPICPPRSYTTQWDVTWVVGLRSRPPVCARSRLRLPHTPHSLLEDLLDPGAGAIEAKHVGDLDHQLLIILGAARFTQLRKSEVDLFGWDLLDLAPRFRLIRIRRAHEFQFLSRPPEE